MLLPCALAIAASVRLNAYDADCRRNSPRFRRTLRRVKFMEHHPRSVGGVRNRRPSSQSCVSARESRPVRIVSSRSRSSAVTSGASACAAHCIAQRRKVAALNLSAMLAPVPSAHRRVFEACATVQICVFRWFPVCTKAYRQGCNSFIRLGVIPLSPRPALSDAPIVQPQSRPFPTGNRLDVSGGGKLKPTERHPVRFAGG
jgi:hypothetical protein